MKYTKKMIVVPYIQATIEDPRERYIVDLNNEMSQILSKRDSNVDEKVKLYLQTLVKFKEKFEPSISMNQAVGNIRTDISEFLNTIKNPAKPETTKTEPIEPVKTEPVKTETVKTEKKLIKEEKFRPKSAKKVKFNETPKRKQDEDESSDNEIYQTPGKFSLNLSDSIIDEESVSKVLKEQIKETKSPQKIDYLKTPALRRNKKTPNYNENVLRQANENKERAKLAWGDLSKQIKKNEKGEIIIPSLSDFTNWVTK